MNRADTPEELYSKDLPTEDRAATASKLFREHNRTLIGFLFARVRNEQEAREIAQEAYVKVLQLEPKPGASNFMRSYLFRVAENLAVDRIRQRRSRSRLDELNAARDFIQEDLTQRSAIADQELTLLRRAIAELPDKCGEAFRLHKLEDLPVLEVAARMGLTDRMVRKYLARALFYIRLRKEGSSPMDAWEKAKA